MKLLTLNIGNTTILGAITDGGRSIEDLRVKRTPSLGPELEKALATLVSQHKPDLAVLCSVVPTWTPVLKDYLETKLRLPVELLHPGAHHGLEIAYPHPSRLGSDRLAAVLGAQALLPGCNLIIVDLGTATTVTALSAQGRLCGGAILPGVGLWSQALEQNTAQLPEIQISKPERVTGDSPETAIQSGIYHGHLGALERLVREISQECFGAPPTAVLATGGNAALFQSEMLFTRVEEKLIVLGLAAFADKLRQDA